MPKMEEEFYEKERNRFLSFTAVFVCCMATVNILSAKLWTLGGIAINAGIVFYWITFPITDVIGEVYGRKKPLSLFGLALEPRF